MPQHGQTAKWTKLATNIGWDGDNLTLQRFALIAVSVIPNPKVRTSFLEYYFEEEDDNHTASYYNNNVVVRETIQAVYEFSKRLEIDPLAVYEHVNLNDLKDMVRYGR